MAPGQESTTSPAYGHAYDLPVAALTSRKVGFSSGTATPLSNTLIATVGVDALSASVRPLQDSEPGAVLWAMDSGASHHICNDQASMTNLRSTNISVRLGENTTLPATAIGDIKIEQVPFLVEALLIPQFRISLLSIPCMDARGYTSTFNNGTGTVKKGVRKLSAKLQDGLYCFTTPQRSRLNAMSSLLAKSFAVSTRSMALKQNAPTVVIQAPIGGIHDDMTPPPSAPATIVPPAAAPKDASIALPTAAPKDASIAPPATVPRDVIVHRHRGKRASAAEWHRRLGHMHAEGLKKVLHPELLSDKIPDKFECRVCIESKHQVSYSRVPATRSTVPFEKVHSDMCGPFRVTSTGNSDYYIIYIDDCTRYCVVYFLTTKAAEEVITRWRHFHAWVKGLGYRIQAFHSDNGTGEYANDTFQSEISSEGIV